MITYRGLQYEEANESGRLRINYVVTRLRAAGIAEMILQFPDCTIDIVRLTIRFGQPNGSSTSNLPEDLTKEVTAAIFGSYETNSNSN
jgi:hypothetical protein